MSPASPERESQVLRAELDEARAHLAEAARDPDRLLPAPFRAAAAGTTDAALADFRVLRDDAPNEEVRLGFTRVVDELTRAREAFAAGQAIVEASDPLTPEAYGAGVDQFVEGTRSYSLVAQIVDQIELPPEYRAASEVAPNCRE